MIYIPWLAGYALLLAAIIVVTLGVMGRRSR